MLSDNVEPSRNVTIGGSANKKTIILMRLILGFVLLMAKNYFNIIPSGWAIFADKSHDLRASFVMNYARFE